jgi:glycosyltransferase involved in cell wall biosynthesis
VTGRILLAVTADASVGFVRGTARHLARDGWDVHIASAPGPLSTALAADGVVTVHATSMRRNPSPLSDLRDLGSAVALLRRVRPDVVSAATPKAGLLFTLAARAALVPVRVYQLWGLRYETTSGAARRVLMMLERTAVRASTEVIAVSASLRDVAVADRIAPAGRISIMGAGSSHGVDVEHFAVTPEERARRQRERWPDDPYRPVVAFVGRLHADKGVDTMLAAIAQLADQGVCARLIVVGELDGADQLLLTGVDTCGWPAETWGHVEDVSDALAVSDVLCLPSKREGFPNVVLEAAAAGVPTVATAATGIADAVLDGCTGLVSPTRDPAELADRLGWLLGDANLRGRLGSAARDRVRALYDHRLVQAAYADHYRALLRAAQ